jgi:hypothetical protein
MKVSEERKNREIDVIIKAKELFALGESATEDQIDKLTALTSNQVEGGQSDWVSHKDFELAVFKNHTMRWIIVPNDSKGEDIGYELRLVSVNHNPTDGSPNIFNTEVLNVGSDSYITAPISNNATENKDYIYTIRFTITHARVTNTYSIDPKLKINS